MAKDLTLEEVRKLLAEGPKWNQVVAIYMDEKLSPELLAHMLADLGWASGYATLSSIYGTEAFNNKDREADVINAAKLRVCAAFDRSYAKHKEIMEREAEFKVDEEADDAETQA